MKAEKAYLRRKQAGGFPGATGFEPRPGWQISTYWRGPLQFDAVDLLHSQGPIIGRIRPLVDCKWISAGEVKRYLIPYEIELSNGGPPVLLDVCGDKAVLAAHVRGAHAAIREQLDSLGCSALWVWRAAFMRGEAARANFTLMFALACRIDEAERLAVLTALQTDGPTNIDTIITRSGLDKDRGWIVVLNLLLSGVSMAATKCA